MIAEPNPPQRGESSASGAEDRLETRLADGGFGTWELHPNDEHRTLRLSPELQGILGLSQAEFDGTLRSFVVRVHPGDRRRVLRQGLTALRRSTAPELEFRFFGPDQTLRWLLVRGRIEREGEGPGARLAGIGIEVTRQKAVELELLRRHAELQRRLEERTEQLRAATQELDSFCYSVSHDLRAPLRSVRGFNEVLLERYGPQMDPRAQEFLRRACEAGHNMDELIDGLLKLSRVGRAPLSRRRVDLSQLARAVAAQLLVGAGARQVQFDIAPGLQTAADERLLRIALENLLGNAWKFTCRRADALIEVGTDGSAGTFFVRDNGAGFDPAYTDRLFGVFQRLHSEKELAGTGAGLAIVQRIIQRHGGRVWAIGAVDRGATFYFSIPNDETL
jgi:hypothetical protein